MCMSVFVWSVSGVSEEFLEEGMVITYYSMGYHAHKRKRKERMKDDKEFDKENCRGVSCIHGKDFKA